MEIKNIGLKDPKTTLGNIIDRYCEGVTDVPTEVAKKYIHGFNQQIPPKLVRQLLFAGAYFAIQHKDELEITGMI